MSDFMLKMASVIILVLSVWALALTNPALAKEDAIETLKKAAEADPKDYAPHFGLGQAYYTMGLYDKAIAEYKKTIALEPLFAVAHSGLGSSF